MYHIHRADVSVISTASLRYKRPLATGWLQTICFFLHSTSTINLYLPGVMSFHLVPYLPRLVAMFFMCDRKVSNLLHYLVVILFILTTMVKNTKL